MNTETETESSPFQWGDRIDHKLFGFGTVDGEPIAVCGADPRTHRTVPKGWRVPVKWDDPNRTATRVASFALRLVTRPDAKGGPFWNHEYRKLLEKASKARAATDAAMERSFRPNEGDGIARLDSALDAEQSAIADLRTFLEADEAGDHP